MQSATLPPLIAGERLDWPTFHVRYSAMPESVWAELIEGVVHILPPVKASHGRVNAEVICWLGRFHMETPGVEVLAHTTTILGKDDEVQPDACLCVLPECGGQTREDKEGYLNGALNSWQKLPWGPPPSTWAASGAPMNAPGVREYIVLGAAGAARCLVRAARPSVRSTGAWRGWHSALGVLRRPVDGPGGDAPAGHAPRRGGVAARSGFAGAQGVFGKATPAVTPRAKTCINCL